MCLKLEVRSKSQNILQRAITSTSGRADVVRAPRGSQLPIGKIPGILGHVIVVPLISIGRLGELTMVCYAGDWMRLCVAYSCGRFPGPWNSAIGSALVIMIDIR